MRLDKFLKVSRIIKRRSVANEVCAGGRVSVNDKSAKPGTAVKVGDIIKIRFGNKESSFEILAISEHVTKEAAGGLYRVLAGQEIE